MDLYYLNKPNYQMNKDTIIDYIEDSGHEDVIIFENPDYANAFLGVSDEGRAVYSYYKMIDCLMAEEDMTDEEAIEFIEFNTMRAIPCMGTKPPIVLTEM